MESRIRVDVYTKVVLTVIAVALCVLVGQNMVSPAVAFGESSCGSTFTPCRIEIHHTGYIQ